MTRSEAMDGARQAAYTGHARTRCRKVLCLERRLARMRSKLNRAIEDREAREALLVMAGVVPQAQIPGRLRAAGFLGWTVDRVRRVIERAKKTAEAGQ